MNNKFRLQFTKFFDVESPITNNDNLSDVWNIGIDVYFPKPTQEFVDALLVGNPGSTLRRLKISDDGARVVSFRIMNKNGFDLIEYSEQFDYEIFNNMQVPTGLGILIPSNYYIDMRCKSGNFKNSYTSITGLIDPTYTYGMSVQILKFDSSSLIIKPNEKFAQFVLRKAEEIEQLIYVPVEDWNTLTEVISRRTKRTGGYGSTGKFVNGSINHSQLEGTTTDHTIIDESYCKRFDILNKFNIPIVIDKKLQESKEI